MLKNIISTLKKIKNNHEDAKIGRKLVGMDRDQNAYYQYYDQNGIPTRRSCEPVNRIYGNFKIDPVWDEWLRGRQKDPWTEEQLQQIYKKRDYQHRVVESYERRDYEMLRSHRQSQEYQQKRAKEEKFNPEEWFNQQNKKE